MDVNEYKEMLRDYVFMTNEDRAKLHSDLTKEALFTNAMQMGYIALNSIDTLEEIAEQLIGTEQGKKLDEILNKFHNFPWQEKVWRKFYMTFNDNNERHCENAFFNNHYETENELRIANKEWVEDIQKMGVTSVEILKHVPEARFFLKEEN